MDSQSHYGCDFKFWAADFDLSKRTLFRSWTKSCQAATAAAKQFAVIPTPKLNFHTKHPMRNGFAMF